MIEVCILLSICNLVCILLWYSFTFTFLLPKDIHLSNLHKLFVVLMYISLFTFNEIIIVLYEKGNL